jgi:hypothetical protein
MGSLNLAKISRILVQFTPWSGEGRCAREFLARISGGAPPPAGCSPALRRPGLAPGFAVRTEAPAVRAGKAAATNPDCDVTVRVREKGGTFVEVEYANKEVERFDTPRMTAQDLAARISVRCEELETSETLQRVGIGKLDSAWGVQGYDAGKKEIVLPG